MESFFLEHAMPESVGSIVSLIWMVFAFSKGIARQMVGVICFGFSFIAGYWAFRNSPSFLSPFMSTVPTTAMVVSSILAGGIVHQGLKKVLGQLFEAGGPAVTPRGRMAHAVVSILPSSIVIIMLAMALRWVGAISLMGSVRDSVDHPATRERWEMPYTSRIMCSLSHGFLGLLTSDYDPFQSHDAAILSALLINNYDARVWAALNADPETGNILRHPAVKNLIQDNDWTRAVSHQSHARILLLPELKKTLETEAVKKAVHELDLPAVLRRAWDMAPPKARVVR